jgi:hypothetical protein
MVIFHDAQRKVKPDSEYLPGPRGISGEWLGDMKFRSTLEAAGFQAKDIEITTETASMTSNMWVSGLELMKDVLVNDVVQGWTDKEKEEYNVALKEQFELENANTRPTEMVAWVAVARKQPLDGANTWHRGLVIHVARVGLFSDSALKTYRQFIKFTVCANFWLAIFIFAPVVHVWRDFQWLPRKPLFLFLHRLFSSTNIQGLLTFFRPWFQRTLRELLVHHL